MKKLLLHLDTDTVASTFDQAVAYDSGVDNIIAHGGATRDNVTSHVPVSYTHLTLPTSDLV